MSSAETRRRPRAVTALLSPIVPLLLLAWWYVATVEAEGDTPTPLGVVGAAGELLSDGELTAALGTSLIRVLAGFGLALLLGTIVGFLMARFRVVYEALDPLIESVRPIAPIALVPLSILWLGTGSAGAVGIITYAAFFPVVLNVHASVRRLDRSLSDAARTFGASELTILHQVVLPGIVPGLITGARVAMGLAWASVIAAELAIGTDSGETAGIGQLMLTFYQYEVDPHPIVVCMVAVGITGLVLDQLLRVSGRLLTPWNR